VASKQKLRELAEGIQVSSSRGVLLACDAACCDVFHVVVGYALRMNIHILCRVVALPVVCWRLVWQR
jgi:hypothetical protein